MKYYKYNLSLCLVILLGVLVTISCESSVETYDQFLDINTVSEIGAPTDVTSVAGTGRAIFKLAIPADPRLKSGIIEWSELGQAKSEKFQIVRDTPSLDTLTLALNNLKEGSLQFSFKVFDVDGKTSKILTHGRIIYGEQYKSNLLARRFDAILTSSTDDPSVDQAVVVLSTPLPEMLDTFLTYEDQNGVEQILTLGSQETEVTILGYNREVPFKVTTEYIPEIDALDTYMSKETSGVFPKIEVFLDKALWSQVILPTDMGAVNGQPARPLSLAWDGTASPFIAEPADPSTFIRTPYTFTIDFGVSTILTRFEMQGHPYGPVNPKRFQIWATNDISDAGGTVDLQDISDLTPEEQADFAKVAEKRAQNLVDWEAESVDKGWTKLLDVGAAPATGFTGNISDQNDYQYIRYVFIEEISPIPNRATAFAEITVKGLQ